MDFKQAQQRRERGASVSDLLGEWKDDENKYDEVIIIGRTHDKEIMYSYSTDDEAGIIGMMEVVKDIIIEEVRGD